MKKRTAALLLALVLVIGAAVGGTVAWLVDTTGSVTNTFTIGDVNIELEETTGSNYNYVPGATISKDPEVTVYDSVASYVFVKVVVANNSVTVDGVTVNPVLTWEMADSWKCVDSSGNAATFACTNGTYYFYREVDANLGTTATNSTAKYAVLKNDQVKVSEAVTKAMVSTLESKKPTLTFTAAVVQKDNVGGVAKALAASGLV